MHDLLFFPTLKTRQNGRINEKLQENQGMSKSILGQRESSVHNVRVALAERAPALSHFLGDSRDFGGQTTWHIKSAFCSGQPSWCACLGPGSHAATKPRGY